MLEEPKKLLSLRNLKDDIMPRLERRFIRKDSVASNADYSSILDQVFNNTSTPTPTPTPIPVPEGGMLNEAQVVQALQRVNDTYIPKSDIAQNVEVVSMLNTVFGSSS